MIGCLPSSRRTGGPRASTRLHHVPTERRAERIAAPCRLSGPRAWIRHRNRNGARLATGAVTDRMRATSADRGGLLAIRLDRVVVELRRVLGGVLGAAAGVAIDVEQIADPLEGPDPA